MRNASKLVMLAALVAAVHQPSYAFDLKGFFGFGDKDEQQESAAPASSMDSIKAMAKEMLADQNQEQGTLNNLLQNPILETITNNLNVSSTQAATGTAALLGMASQQLGTAGSTELDKIMPQIGELTSLLPAGLSENLSSLSQVKTLFQGLGMDPSMISQFVPIITGGLTNLGASPELVSQLNSIWQAL